MERKEKILELIESAMQYANNVVFDKSKNADELKGMGTTLEICLIYNNRAYIGHIGDSRSIRLDQLRRIIQISRFAQHI